MARRQPSLGAIRSNYEVLIVLGHIDDVYSPVFRDGYAGGLNKWNISTGDLSPSSERGLNRGFERRQRKSRFACPHIWRGKPLGSRANGERVHHRQSPQAKVDARATTEMGPFIRVDATGRKVSQRLA